MTAIGPVSFVAAGFGPRAALEGQIRAELERFARSGMLRVLDVWARELEEAVTATGGAILQQGLLDPEATQALVR
jgi:hypothetical protein